MEDTKKTKKTTSKNKNKNNYEPKWKAKKEGITTKSSTKNSTPKNNQAKKSVKKDDKKVENKEQIKTTTQEREDVEIKEKSLKNVINKKESGKSVNKEKLVKKYNISDTIPISIPEKEELDKIYNDMKKTEVSEMKPSEEIVVNKTIYKKKHYNYISRIATLVSMIVLFLILCVLFIFKALDYQLGGSTTYSEYTSNDYIVCTNGVSVYNAENCLGKDLDYISNLVKNIHASFNYESVYSKKHTFNSSYFVIAKLKIYDHNDATRIRYTKDYTLINDTEINVTGEVITFSTDVDIDFNNYRNLVSKYITETGVSSSAEVEVGLYLREGDVSRKISYITVPLTEESFMIKSSNLDNQNQLVISNSKTRIIDPFYVFIAVICLLMDILLFTYLANLMYMVKHLDNEYNTKLKTILKENDELIVNATSDYIIPENANVIKVESFEELMDARNTLEKPIVYERINNIKSKFYVEDGNTIYVYTMKDDGE